MRRLKTAIILALLTVAACGAGDTTSIDHAAPAGIVAGRVTAARVSGGVSVTNGTERGVAYSVWNPNFLGLLGTCSDPAPSCVRLAPGAQVVVPIDSIVGWNAQTTEIIVYWWHVLPASTGGYEAGQVGRVTLSMK